VSGSDLRSRALRYVALRREMGFQSRATERLLLDFVAFAETRGQTEAPTTQLAVDWACSPAGGRRDGARRLSVLRGFLAHVRASLPQTQVPAVGLLRGPRRPAPHIFSDEEMTALLRAARSLGPAGALRPYTYVTLIGLLASCGLRIGEAVGLRVGDVRLEATPPHLLISESKFRKSRLVMLHPSAVTALREYVRHREHLGYSRACGAFFVSEKPGPLPAGSARRTFARIARCAGVRPATGRGAHLHDLRHTFAVRRLLLWCRAGVDVRARLPELSVYLGHVRPADTYWYLTATPELLATAASRFEDFVGAGGES
jgi:integrase/recombinase XerD